jgi:deazaflavin-dependent oxidoreductase (nitroreductase family)
MSEANENQKIIDEFRANGGKVGGWFEGAPMLLLHTTGAKSGLPRVNPLMYQQVGDDVAVFASKAGAPTNPDRYYNLRANPNVEIELGTETIPVTASVADDDERDRASGGSRRRGIQPLPSTRRQQRDGRSQSSSSPDKG